MKTIGKYEIIGLLGRGGMSVVYKARLPVVRKIVALKLLSPHPHLAQVMEREAIEGLFVGEATTMATLRHPHVAELLDFDTAHGVPFFTMEYYFQNLGQIMGEGRRAEAPSRVLSLDKVIHYGRQILLGLSRLHRTGVIHRDIKPFNLLVNEEEVLKICDFGLSTLRGEKLRRRGNLVLGSPFYAAPEQERDPEEVDERADVYSAGIVFHRMLTGELPVEGETRPSKVHPDADPAWDEFVFRAIARDREKRFCSAWDMLQELETLAAGWTRRKGELCSALPPETLNPGESAPPAPALRITPLKIRVEEAPEVFQCDTLGRPLRFFDHRLALTAAGDLVLDQSTGLIWQRSGSPDPVEWSEAQGYVASLNASCHGGLRAWRLPTVNELFSLLKPFAHNRSDCVDGVFDRTRKWLWSADRRTFTSAWHVNTELGYAGWGDFTCRYTARAVCRPV